MSDFKRMVTVNDGLFGRIGDSEGNVLGFESLEQMSRVTGIDFTDKFNMNYEPELPHFSDSRDPDVGPEMIPYEPYEELIAMLPVLQERAADPYYGLSEGEIQTKALQVNQQKALENREQASWQLTDHQRREDLNIPSSITPQDEINLRQYIITMQAMVENPSDDPEFFTPPPPATQQEL